MKHQTHHEVHMNIPHHKLKKLAHGHRIQLEHHELSHGPHHLMLHHETAKKLHTARASHKGMRIGPLTHEEIHASGSLWDSIKSGFNKYIKPVLSGVGDAIAYANPELAPLREGVRSITGVGIKHKKHKKHVVHHSEGLRHGVGGSEMHPHHEMHPHAMHHSKHSKVSHAGSAEMKARMAKVRAAKKGTKHTKHAEHAAGSFLLY